MNSFLWMSMLSLATAALTLESRAVAPELVEKKSESFSSGGRRIRVETFAPKGNQRLPAVVMLHSSAGTVLGKRAMEHLARSLASNGEVVFFVHYFDRTGTVFAGDRSIDENSPAWTETARDAVDFAATHPRARKDALGLFGYSLGAFLAVAEASRDARVRAVVEVSGGIFKGFAPRMRRLPPTLILHGRADERVPVARAFELEKKAHGLGAKPLVKIYEGEGHVLSSKAMSDATRRTLAFFAAHLHSS